MSEQDGNAPTEGYVPKINQFAETYIEDLKKEQQRLPEDFPLIMELVNDSIDRVYATGRTPGKELKADVFKQKPIKLSQNVYLPVKQYPKFNFQGKILGPKGNTLKRLHKETMCSIAVKGRHSIRDQEREESLRQSGDPAYNHLNKNLFVEISTVAPPAEAYARIAYALSEIRKYIIPDKNDEVSHEQYRELMEIDPSMAKGKYGNNVATKQQSVLTKMKMNFKGNHNTFSSNSNDDEDDDDDNNGFEEVETPKPPMPPSFKNFNKFGGEASSSKRTVQSPSLANKKKNLYQPYQRNLQMKQK